MSVGAVNADLAVEYGQFERLPGAKVGSLVHDMSVKESRSGGARNSAEKAKRIMSESPPRDPTHKILPLLLSRPESPCLTQLRKVR